MTSSLNLSPDWTQRNSFTVEELYTGYNMWLCKWFMRRLGCSEQSADYVQDTFIRLLKKSHQLEIEQPRAYLTTIAQGIVANHYRRQDVERAYMLALSNMEESHAPSEEEKYQMLESLLNIDERLQQLKQIVQQAFLLSQIDGMKQGDIAEKLNISVATVKRYVSQALVACAFDDA